jgi:hypothetical protein
MWREAKKKLNQFGKSAKRALNEFVEDVDEALTNAVVEAKRPETEQPIKDVVDEINRALTRLKVKEPYTSNDSSIKAAIQMKSQLGDALRTLDRELGNLNAKDPIQVYNSKWDAAVAKFNKSSAEVIRAYRSDIVNSPWNGWTPLKKFANIFIAIYNALPGEGRIEPYTFDKTEVTMASNNNLKGQLDTLKEEMVDQQPSMRPKK